MGDREQDRSVRSPRTHTRRVALGAFGAVGVGIFGALRTPATLVNAAERLAPPVSFRTPDAAYGSSPLPLDLFLEANPEIPWAGMDFVTREVIGRDKSIAVGGEKPFAPIIKDGLVLEAPLTLVLTRIRLNGGGVGIAHLLPDMDRTQTMVEVRANRDIYAIVRSGTKGEVQGPSAQIGKAPEGDEVVLGMLFTNSGSTFGGIGTEGLVAKEVDLEVPTVGVGEPSTLIAYTWDKGASAEVLSTVIASQKVK